MRLVWKKNKKVSPIKNNPIILCSALEKELELFI
jgi:hypothetical protein